MTEKTSNIPGKQLRPKTERAREVLRKAINNGTIRDVLWGKESRNIAIETKNLLPTVSTDDDPYMITLEEAALLDSVTIWNKALVSRILKTARLIQQQKEKDILHSNLTKKVTSSDSEDEETEDEINGENDSKKISKKNLQNRERKKRKRKLNVKSKEKKEEVSKEESDLTPETNAFEISLLLASAANRPRRVSEIIKSVQVNVSNKLKPSTNLSYLAEDVNESDNSGRMSEGTSHSSLESKEEIDHFDPEAGPKVHWGGTKGVISETTDSPLSSGAPSIGTSAIAKLKKKSVKKKRQEYSLQVVEGLFNMSNELREERESIMAHGKDGSNNMEAFINRETTLKYNEELDAVARNRTNEVSTQRKAALLRLKRAALKYKTYKFSHSDRFSAFWDYLLHFNNEHMDRQSAYTNYVVGEEEEESDGDENCETDLNGQKQAKGLESIFEENIGLLFATKNRAAEMSQSTGSKVNLSPNRRLKSAGGAKFHRVDEVGNEDVNQNDRKSSSGSLSIRSNVERRSIKSGISNQRDMSSMIERMKAMGVYSEEKLRYTYGMHGVKTEMNSKNGHSTGITNKESNLSDGQIEWGEVTHNLQISPIDRWLADSDDSQSLVSMDVSQDSESTDDASLNSFNYHDVQESGEDDSSFGRKKRKRKRKRKQKRHKMKVESIIKHKDDTHIQSNVVADSSMADDSFESSHADSSFQRDDQEDFNSFPFPVATAINSIQKSSRGIEKLRRKQERKVQDSKLAKADAWLHRQIADFARAGKLPKVITETADEDKERCIDEVTEEKQTETFLTEFLNYIDIDPFHDHTQGEERAVYHQLRMTAPHHDNIDPDSHYLVPNEKLYPQANSSLRGKWRYDQTISSLLSPKIYQKIRRAVVKKLKKGDAMKSRHRAQYADRERYRINYRRNIYKELVFDPERRHLVLRTCEDHDVLSSLSVNVSEVYLTDATYQDMVTVRTTNTTVVPSGYLGTFPVSQWRGIEEEINASMLLQHLLESKDVMDSLLGDEEAKEDDHKTTENESTEVSDTKSNLSTNKKNDLNLLPFQKLEKLRQETQISFQKFPSIHEGPARNHMVPCLQVHPHDTMVFRRADAKRKAALLAMENDLDLGPTEDQLFPLQALIPKLSDVYAHPASQHFIKEHIEAKTIKDEANALEKEETEKQATLSMMLRREVEIKQAAEQAAQFAAMTRVISSDRLRQRLAVEQDIQRISIQHSMGYEATGHVACGDQVSLSLVGVSTALRQPVIASLDQQQHHHHASDSTLSSSFFSQYSPIEPLAVVPVKPQQPKKTPSFRTKKLTDASLTNKSTNRNESNNIFKTALPPKQQSSSLDILQWDDSSFGSSVRASSMDLLEAPGITSAHLLPGASTVYHQYLSPYVPGLEKELQAALYMRSSIALQADISSTTNYFEAPPELAAPPTAATSPTVTSYYLPPLVRWSAISSSMRNETLSAHGITGTIQSPAMTATSAVASSQREAGYERPTTRDTTVTASTISTASHYSFDKNANYIGGSSNAAVTPTVPIRNVAEEVQQTVEVAPVVLDATNKFVNSNTQRIASEITSSIQENIKDDPEKLPFSYAFQIIMLIDSRRIMQLYFTKKFLQMDIAVNVHMRFDDATESLLTAPDWHGLIFISYLDLIANDVKKSLGQLIPDTLMRDKYSVIVYDVAIGEEDNSEELALLEACGITDIMYPPYSVTTLKEVLNRHRRKQELRREFR